MTKAKDLRVLHLLNSLSDRGNGIVNVAVDLALDQARRGLSVAFASDGGGFAPLLEAAGVRCFLAPQRRAASMAANSLRLLRLLRSFRPTVVHAHMRSGVILVWPWTRLLRIPLFMHLHNVHDPAHGLLLLPDRILAVSEAVRRELLRQRVADRRIRVVLNGCLGSTRIVADPAVTASLLHPAIVTVAGLMHRKGIAELIEAFGKIAIEHPRANLYIVGGGTELAHFQDLASRSGVGSRIHFEGFQENPRQYLNSADVFVLASRRESFGLAIIEARAARCAIIATHVDGIPELLDGGRCGLLVPPRDASALAEQMDRLLRNPGLQESLRQQTQPGLEFFTVERMTDQVLAAYNEVLGDPCAHDSRGDTGTLPAGQRNAS